MTEENKPEEQKPSVHARDVGGRTESSDWNLALP